MSSILVSLLGSAPLSPFQNELMDLVLKGALPKRATNLELILFWGQGPKIYKAKTRSYTKGLFYIRGKGYAVRKSRKQIIVSSICPRTNKNKKLAPRSIVFRFWEQFRKSQIAIEIF